MPADRRRAEGGVTAEKAAGVDDGLIHDPAAECAAPEVLRSRQATLLSGLVDRLLADAGRLGERLRAAGVAAGADVGLADLAALPTCDKTDLWESYPFGMIGVPADRLAAVHGSSGTGGRPTLVGYTVGDLALWAQLCARALAAAGARPGWIVHNAYGYGLFTGGLGIHQGALARGVTVVPASGGMTTRQLRLIEDLQPKMLTCTPSYAVTLGEEARRSGANLSSLRVGVFGAEPWSEAMRGQLEELLGLAALDIYGLSEMIGPGVSCECLERAGLHVNEDHILVEAIDPETSVPVPDGTPGELVFSTPTREALPLLRYRTGDIAALDHRPCACGRTLVRMTKILGRRDDMLVIRGVNVYPSEVEAVLLADPLVGPHYQLVVDRRGPVPALVVCCETATADAGEAGRERLAAALRQRLGVRAEVLLCATGSLPRTEVGKAVRVTTWSAGPPPFPGSTREPR
jgi:phenylacetate-coenzyme A ligase PaaK-like adenylate-forming protein